MKHLVTITTGLLLLSNILFSQQITQNFSFSTADLQISQSGDFDIVLLPDTYFLEMKEMAGKPQLPIKHFKLLLPQGALATNVSITTNNEEQLNESFYLYPLQLPVYPNGEAPPPFTEPDSTIYNSSEPFPESTIYSYNTCGYRDYNYVDISFIPFRYIPLSRQLYLLNNITITVDYIVNSLNENHKLRDYGSVDGMAYESIRQMVNNPLQTDAFYPEAVSKINQYKTKGSITINGKAFEPTDLPALEGSPVHYVIITNNSYTNGNPILNDEGNPVDFVAQFQAFANWKTQSGSPAKVVTVDEIRDTY